MQADKKLKERYAMKREVIMKKYQLKQRRVIEEDEAKPIVLNIKPPAKIDRENDLDILRKMTSEVLKGKNPAEINIDRFYTQTHNRNI